MLYRDRFSPECQYFFSFVFYTLFSQHEVWFSLACFPSAPHAIGRRLFPLLFPATFWVFLSLPTASNPPSLENVFFMPLSFSGDSPPDLGTGQANFFSSMYAVVLFFLSLSRTDQAGWAPFEDLSLLQGHASKCSFLFPPPRC